MKIVSWPSTAESNFKAVLVHITKMLAAEYITFNKCMYPCLGNVYSSCLSYCRGHGARISENGNVILEK